MKRVLVCGGRDFNFPGSVYRALDIFRAERGIALVIHGAARGADRLAGEWAAERGVPVVEYPADWAAHGRAAGPKRNQRMIDEGKPDFVVAFPGGAGTADMVRRAKAAGIPVWEVPA